MPSAFKAGVITDLHTVLTEGVGYYFVDPKLSIQYWRLGSGIEICLRTVRVGIDSKVLHCVAKVKTGVGYLVRGNMTM